MNSEEVEIFDKKSLKLLGSALIVGITDGVATDGVVPGRRMLTFDDDEMEANTELTRSLGLVGRIAEGKGMEGIEEEPIALGV